MEWDESKHPREEDGRFSSSEGSGVSGIRQVTSQSEAEGRGPIHSQIEPRSLGELQAHQNKWGTRVEEAGQRFASAVKDRDKSRDELDAYQTNERVDLLKKGPKGIRALESQHKAELTKLVRQKQEVVKAAAREMTVLAKQEASERSKITGKEEPLKISLWTGSKVTPDQAQDERRADQALRYAREEAKGTDAGNDRRNPSGWNPSGWNRGGDFDQISSPAKTQHRREMGETAVSQTRSKVKSLIPDADGDLCKRNVGSSFLRGRRSSR